MPRKYVRVADRVAAVAAGTDPHLSEALEARHRRNEEIMSKIMTAFSATGHTDEWTCKIHRISGNNRLGFGEPYLFTVSPDEIETVHDTLRDEYGSGRYRCRAYQNRQLVNSFEIDIESKIEPIRLPAPIEAPAPKAGDAMTIIQALEQSNMRMMEFFERRLTQLAPAPVDPMASMTQLATLMTTMKTLMPEPPAQNLDILMKGIELARDFGGSGETGLMDIVKEFAKSPVIETLIANAAGRRGQVLPAPEQPAQLPAPARRVLPANPTPIMPTAGPNHQAMGQDDVNALVAAQLGKLVGMAALGIDPALVAENVYDNLPDATLEYIVSSPNIIAELTQIDRRVAQHVVWFQHLLAAVKQIDQEVQADEATGPANGDVPDIGGAARNGPDASGDAANHPPVQDKPGHKGTQRKVGAKAAA